MTQESHDPDTVGDTLQSVYHEVRLHSPQGIDDVQERLRGKLELHGLTLTTDIALAFAIVNGRNL